MANARGGEQAIPQIELCLREPGVGTQNPVGESRIILALLFAKLIPRTQQQQLRDLEIVLPLQPIREHTNFIGGAERRAECPGDQTALQRA